MNGVDYSKALAENRDMYRKASRQLQDTTRKELKRQEETHDVSQKKSQKNYLDSKMQLDKDYETNLGKMSEKTQDILGRTKDNFHENLKDEKERFSHESTRNNVNFQNKLNELKDSFKTALEAERGDHEAIQEIAKKNYFDQVNSQVGDNDKILNEFLEKTASTRDVVDRKEADERKALMGQLNKDLYKVRKEVNDKLPVVIDQKNEQIDKLRLLHSREKEALLHHQDEVLRHDKKINNDSLLATQEDFKFLAKNTKDEHLKDKKDNAEWIAERLDAEERKNYEEKDVLKKKLAEAHDYPAAGQSNMQNQSSDRKIGEKKFENYRRSVGKERQEQLARADKAKEEYLELIRQGNLKGASDTLQVKQDMIAENQIKAEKIRMEKDQMVDHYKNGQERDQKIAEYQFNSMEKRNEDRLKTETGKLNKRLENLLKTNEDAMSSLRENYAKKHKEMGLKAEKEKSELLGELNYEFQKKIDKSTDGYEDKIKMIQKSTVELEDSFVDKLKKSQSQRTREVEYNKQIFDEIQVENEASKRDLIKVKESKYQKQLDYLREMYESRINGILNLQGKKIKTIVETYEDRLEKLQSEVLRNSQKETMSNKRDVLRLKQDHENEVNKIKATYEEKITELRQGFEIRADKIKHKLT